LAGSFFSTWPKKHRKFNIDYDIFAGLETPGFIKILTKAELVLMTTTEERTVLGYLKGLYNWMEKGTNCKRPLELTAYA
jgi:hypothetical protein